MILFGKKETCQGIIAGYGLCDWWQSEFSLEERKYMNDVYEPLGLLKGSLVEGDFSNMRGGSALSFLYTLVGWFSKDKTIVSRILLKAEEYINDKTDVMELHFFYATKMKAFYKYRDMDTGALNTAIEAAQKQISLAQRFSDAYKKKYRDTTLPFPEGYYQLTVIKEKQGKLQEAIDIAKQAKEQGWSGDWDNRIERYTKKLNKIK